MILWGLVIAYFSLEVFMTESLAFSRRAMFVVRSTLDMVRQC